MRWRGAAAGGLALAVASAAGRPGRAEQALAPYVIEGGAISAPLAGERGDAARGRAIVVDRRKGLCLLCHSGPFPEERFQGTLAPSLSGAGARLTEGQLRLRMVDSAKVNPASLMPGYHRVDGLARVGQAWRDRPILSAREIEDVVAFLATLRE